MSDEIMTEFRAERLPDIDSPAQLATASARKTRPNFTDDYDEGSQVHDNGVRALRAGDGLICYARTCNTDQEETMTVFGDFLVICTIWPMRWASTGTKRSEGEQSTTPPNCTALTNRTGGWTVPRTRSAGSPRHRVRRGPALPHAVITRIPDQPIYA
ncbi:hypothetical protein [Rhodococcus sp. WAY2]|uniref:hypothetical protein n=1 Tax=Rhodococcus sp. WAY2 TaxID=2663121 RepID=UPI00131F8267|nr:hypothetical protein [Rhodococcus sp. WAY2]QHE72789.1 hypothetical protein GFS60_06437 [Rhodococcus sp. WAY2]